MDPTSQSYAVFFGLAGAASSLILSGAGAAYGTAKACRGIAKISTPNNDTQSFGKEYVELSKTGESNAQQSVGYKNMIPVVISGVLAIYGLIYSVIVSSSVVSPSYSTSQGYANFFGGLAVGFCCLVAGIAVGVCGEAGIVASARNSKMFTLMVLVLVYCEALGLYGLIFSLIANSLAF
uniref:V-ATPase proteolipid subunit C-like domain-containing protein n=1 Tax=Vannella robusta TaxID=1487602 RepID=A0A7S4MQ15_9EUKA|mmetsp:Transcript_5903/g.7267  ORF Transcript_5903/g.7267 Transcript_5903/m.7267 type:complete len:179 (+) Transcript_5903:543-1079(+)